QKISPQKFWQKIKPLLAPKSLIILLISLFILIHLLFIPFLLASLIFTYHAFLSFKKENFKTLSPSLAIANSLLLKSKDTYRIVRPTYLLFSVALLPENLIDITDKTQNIISNLYQINNNVKEIQKLIFKKNKTAEEKSILTHRLGIIKNEISSLDENLKIINQRIPSQIIFFQNRKNQLAEVADIISKIKKITVHFDDILGGEKKELKYLILFANNREIRPGGGFLGSFGIVNIKDYTIEDIKIYDVYDADGQLKIHIEPPEAIRKYLHQPHWYLRDSNFSPDFLDNYLKAQFFLEKEMGVSNFDGAILLTTTSIEEILTAFGDIYLPNFNEYINSKNFYLKTQVYSEKNFFPGSIQKKSFLSALVRQIIINLDNASLVTLASAIKKSLDEKQIVVYFNKPKIQKLFDLWYWSGRVIDPKCNNPSEKCLSDYFFAYDANLGVNKANFFVSRSFVFKTSFNPQGTIQHLISLQYKNESPSEVFPGGIYRNFFQILLPKNIILKKITKDGVSLEEFTEQKIAQFKNIGFYFEVPPKKTVEIKIEYQLSQKLEKGRQLYQLIVQKQIGSSNNDLILEINLPKNIYLLNQNFSPLVKDRNIIYNTTLNTDKIFFIDLIKD
ncbi:MAG: DUF4012 domain-containing protein, partial [Microgenomates group bacterium]